MSMAQVYVYAIQSIGVMGDVYIDQKQTDILGGRYQYKYVGLDFSTAAKESRIAQAKYVGIRQIYEVF